MAIQLICTHISMFLAMMGALSIRKQGFRSCASSIILHSFFISINSFIHGSLPHALAERMYSIMRVKWLAENTFNDFEQQPEIGRITGGVCSVGNSPQYKKLLFTKAFYKGTATHRLLYPHSAGPQAPSQRSQPSITGVEDS